MRLQWQTVDRKDMSQKSCTSCKKKKKIKSLWKLKMCASKSFHCFRSISLKRVVLEMYGFLYPNCFYFFLLNRITSFHLISSFQSFIILNHAYLTCVISGNPWGNLATMSRYSLEPLKFFLASKLRISLISGCASSGHWYWNHQIMRDLDSLVIRLRIGSGLSKSFEIKIIFFFYDDFTQSPKLPFSSAAPWCSGSLCPGPSLLLFVSFSAFPS